MKLIFFFEDPFITARNLDLYYVQEREGYGEERKNHVSRYYITISVSSTEGTVGSQTYGFSYTEGSGYGESY